MKFTKMHGAGNDFIIIDNREEKIPLPMLGSLAKTLCNRKLSIGADGFMAVDFPDRGGDFKMRFYNADGSLGEMCGNGVRCIARYGWEKKISGEMQKIETSSGMVHGWRLSAVLFKTRLTDISKIELSGSLSALDREYPYAYVELGDPGLPHITVQMEGLNSIKQDKLRPLARAMRYHEAFPKGTNVNFYEVTGENQVSVLTYERGVEDFTLACGTGSGAVVAVLALMGKVGGENTGVFVPGGELYVTVAREAGTITDLYLAGPTCLVAEGEVIEYV